MCWKVIQFKVKTLFLDLQDYEKTFSNVNAALKYAYYELKKIQFTTIEKLAMELPWDQSNVKNKDRAEKIKAQEKLIKDYEEKLPEKNDILSKIDSVQKNVSDAHSLTNTWVQNVMEDIDRDRLTYRFPPNQLMGIYRHIAIVNSTTDCILKQIKRALMDATCILNQYDKGADIGSLDDSAVAEDDIQLPRTWSFKNSSYTVECIEIAIQFFEEAAHFFCPLPDTQKA
jgi:hypothetical protein